MDKSLIDIEVNCLLDAIYQCYGYDFRHYTRATLRRRIEHLLLHSGLKHVSDLIPKVLHDKDFFAKFLDGMSVNVTEMFRDPNMFTALRNDIIPKLKTYSRINVWHAGCATGEEVYSMAILLYEEGVLNRSQIYATDFNPPSLETARAGIYPAKNMRKYTENYLKSGGKRSFSQYYHANYDSAKMNDFLKEKITFAYHNLVLDQVFAEMHLILCRNVLIYFDKVLQDNVLSLLQKSLINKGFLILGNKETLKYSSADKYFEAIDKDLRIFRKLQL